MQTCFVRAGVGSAEGGLNMSDVASAIAALNFDLGAPADQRHLRSLLEQQAPAMLPNLTGHRSAPTPGRAPAGSHPRHSPLAGLVIFGKE